MRVHDQQGITHQARFPVAQANAGLYELEIRDKRDKGLDHHKVLNYIEAANERAVFRSLDSEFLGRHRVFKRSPTTYSQRIGPETGLLSAKIGVKPRESCD